jgi:hypothetical protein
MLVDPANARLAAHLGQRLADYALGNESDPDAARRARAEADFQTRRALKLAPDNKEVKALRDSSLGPVEPGISPASRSCIRGVQRRFPGRSHTANRLV